MVQSFFQIGFVILHYKADQDTAILLAQVIPHAPAYVQIIVVDNGSHNIAHLQEKYQSFPQVSFIVSEKNIGFSRANNLGIRAARRLGCEIVIVSNNDIEGNFDLNFYEKIIHFVQENPQVAVIAPSVVNLKKRYQNPYLLTRPAYPLQKLNFIYNTLAGRLVYYAKWLYNQCLGLTFEKSRAEKIPTITFIYAPHGSFFILTPAYFTHYEALDEGVFLFNEENILAERVAQQGLKIAYLPDLEVLHKEDAATNLLFTKAYQKSWFIRKESYASFRYFLNHYLLKK